MQDGVSCLNGADGAGLAARRPRLMPFSTNRGRLKSQHPNLAGCPDAQDPSLETLRVPFQIDCMLDMIFFERKPRMLESLAAHAAAFCASDHAEKPSLQYTGHWIAHKRIRRRLDALPFKPTLTARALQHSD